MNNVMVSIWMPVVNSCFDMIIPNNMEIKTIISLLSEVIGELSTEQYIISGSELLCRVDTGAVLGMDNTLFAYNIQNGEKLMLL